MPINKDMSHRIRCYTLFDITKTNITSRTKPDDSVERWVHKRNTQCNFDTILQIISLRSQPEVVKPPQRIQIDSSYFGSKYREKSLYCWVFEFEVFHSSVFDNGLSELGSLYTDCDYVPMIQTNTESVELSAFLDTSFELKNIHFEII